MSSRQRGVPYGAPEQLGGGLNNKKDAVQRTIGFQLAQMLIESRDIDELIAAIDTADIVAHRNDVEILIWLPELKGRHSRRIAELFNHFMKKWILTEGDILQYIQQARLSIESVSVCLSEESFWGLWEMLWDNILITDIRHLIMYKWSVPFALADLLRRQTICMKELQKPDGYGETWKLVALISIKVWYLSKRHCTFSHIRDLLIKVTQNNYYSHGIHRLISLLKYSYKKNPAKYKSNFAETLVAVFALVKEKSMRETEFLVSFSMMDPEIKSLVETEAALWNRMAEFNDELSLLAAEESRQRDFLNEKYSQYCQSRQRINERARANYARVRDTRNAKRRTLHKERSSVRRLNKMFEMFQRNRNYELLFRHFKIEHYPLDQDELDRFLRDERIFDIRNNFNFIKYIELLLNQWVLSKDDVRNLLLEERLDIRKLNQAMFFSDEELQEIKTEIQRRSSVYSDE